VRQVAPGEDPTRENLCGKQISCKERECWLVFEGNSRVLGSASLHRIQGEKVRKQKGVVINGVRFRHGEVDWEDAFSASRQKLPDFGGMRQRGQYFGKKVTTAGLVARIGHYLLVIQERDEEQEEFDYTLIPLRAKTEVRYR